MKYDAGMKAVQSFTLLFNKAVVGCDCSGSEFVVCVSSIIGEDE